MHFKNTFLTLCLIGILSGAFFIFNGSYNVKQKTPILEKQPPSATSKTKSENSIQPKNTISDFKFIDTKSRWFFCDIRNILKKYNMQDFKGEIEVKDNTAFFYSPNKDQAQHIDTFITSNYELDNGKAVSYGMTTDKGVVISTKRAQSDTILTGNWTPYFSKEVTVQPAEKEGLLIVDSSVERQNCSKYNTVNKRNDYSNKKINSITNNFKKEKEKEDDEIQELLNKTFEKMDKRQQLIYQAHSLISSGEVTLKNNQGRIVIENGVISVYTLAKDGSPELYYQHSIGSGYEDGEMIVLGKDIDSGEYIVSSKLLDDEQRDLLVSNGKSVKRMKSFNIVDENNFNKQSNNMTIYEDGRIKSHFSDDYHF